MLTLVLYFGGANMHRGINAVIYAGIAVYSLITVVNVATTNSYANQVIADSEALLASIEESHCDRNKRIDIEVKKLSNMPKPAKNVIEPTYEPLKSEVQEATSKEDVTPALLVSEGFGNITVADIYQIQINRGYGIPKEFYYDILPQTMYPLVDTVCYLEETQDISSMFLLAVAAVETGWGKSFYEPDNNNWFNWTTDTITYQHFESAEDCVLYTGEKFEERFFNPEFYANYNQTMDAVFTVGEVNTRYALNPDMSVNWAWTDVVCEIMYSFNSKYQLWKGEFYDL